MGLGIKTGLSSPLAVKLALIGSWQAKGRDDLCIKPSLNVDSVWKAVH